MIHHFNFKDKVVEVSTDKNNWYLKYTDDDNLIRQYNVSYPHPNKDFIRVAYSWQTKRPSNGQVVQSGYGEYQEYNVDTYYDAILPAGISYGHFAAYNAINGLIARLPEFSGYFDHTQGKATGYRIFHPNGDFYQPVVFVIDNISEETRDENNNLLGNGGFEVIILNGVEPFRWRIEGAEVWRTEEAGRVYSDLAAGTYRVEVEDATGTLRYTDVEVPAQQEIIPIPEAEV